MVSTEPEAENVLGGSPNENSELGNNVWAVISFDRVESVNVDYDTAVAILNELNSKGVSGLCIVTADAAGRVLS